MSESRTINYRFNAVDLFKLYEATNNEKVFAALGYLTTWNMTFPQVDIFMGYDHEELIAVYKDEEGNRRYTIGAVWHDDHFGFHS